jgi:SNF2 family DNA or RNA helicase
VRVLKEKKALLFRLREPSKITTVIPTAKLVKDGGVQYVAVPHKPDETRVLRQMGFKVPDPMKTQYTWPGLYKPFDAQKETANFLTMHSRAFCLNSMGVGKTLSALWAYDYMHSIKQVNKALVVCPLSTMERTWADEVFKHFPHLDAVVLYGSAERRRKLLKEDVDLYIINTDGIKTIKNELADRPDINLVIVDESALYRNSGTDRWKALNEIVNKQAPRRVWALTGSPTPNEPTDAWAQCRVVVPTSMSVPKYYNKFRDRVMRQVSQFKWVARDGSADMVKEIMQPAIRYALDDVVDLPPQVFISRDVEMTKEQKHAYKEMLNKLHTEYEGGQILAVNEAVKAGKLVQIACGVAYGTGDHQVVLPAGPRVDLVKELVDESEGKVIVFVPFSGVLQRLAEDLAEEWPTEQVHGGTPKAERDRIFSAFQERNNALRVIVANPATMSHGLTLTAATTIIWFAPVHSNEIYEQACARVRRPGQTKTTVIVNIAGSDVERKIYHRLQTKQALQGSLLDLIKAETQQALD